MISITPAMQKFILHWGEMGTRWGINRTMAQIHALLYVAPAPLPADDIAEALDVARSNVSTSLRELQGWNIVRIVHVKGDRRDHFETYRDVWEMFQIVMDERRRREIDPTILMLKECLEEAERERPANVELRGRLQALLDFFETSTAWYAGLRRMPRGAIIKMVKMGDRMCKALGLSA